jgi:hypothetical protein
MSIALWFSIGFSIGLLVDAIAAAHAQRWPRIEPRERLRLLRKRSARLGRRL